MRCACCNRVINPATAFRKTVVRDAHFGPELSWSYTAVYGPVCAQRLGLTTPAPKRKPRSTQFMLSGPRIVVRVDDEQAELFSATA